MSQGFVAGFSTGEFEFASMTVSVGFMIDRGALGEPFSETFRLILSYHAIIFVYVFTHYARKAFPQPNLKMSTYEAAQSRHVEKL